MKNKEKESKKKINFPDLPGNLFLLDKRRVDRWEDREKVGGHIGRKAHE